MLPSPLWDLVYHRFAASASQLRRPRNIRHVQQLLTRRKPVDVGPNAFPSELQVEESQLEEIFRDLSSTPDVTKNVKVDGLKAQTDGKSIVDLLQVLEKRFLDLPSSSNSRFMNSNSLSTQLLRDRPSKHFNRNNDVVSLNLEEPASDISMSLRFLVSKLQASLQTLDIMWLPSEVNESSALSFGLLSKPEWGALINGALAENDTAVAEQLLGLMKMVGERPSEEHYDTILNWYARQGLIEEADKFCSRFSLEICRDNQRDLLIKARVNAHKLDEACKLLYTFESSATPAPIRSYTRVIQAMLLRSGPGLEQWRAQAWDMLSHMRYTAHPVPDEFLYSTMIRSLAESQDPEAERALDLFTEMTVDNKIAPTTYSYNAVILVCARSKKFKMEAFRLAREMLNSYKDASGEVPDSLKPDKHTFLALLEAAKRLGDITRTRWILTQLIKETRRSRRFGTGITYVDERIMGHVFHAYASYKPPFHRSLAPQHESTQDELTDEGTVESEETPLKNLQTSTPSRSHAPQTHQEVIREASLLWSRILDELELAGSGSVDDLVFDNVSITTNLVNAYMSVYFNHSPPDTALEAFGKTYEELGIPRNARSYLMAFDAYIRGKRSTKHDMKNALAHAKKLWPEWLALEDGARSEVSAHGMDTHKGVDARMVEKVWNSMFRLLAHNDCLDEAMDLVRNFVERYPPSLVKQPSPPNPTRTMKISLYGERPLVRLTERTSIPEDRIPPFLLFKDLELLHHRAVSAKRRDYVDYIKWVASAYAGALRQRQTLTFMGGWQGKLWRKPDVNSKF